MNIIVFLNYLSLGGTEKAACRWAAGLRQGGNTVTVISLQDGPRRADLERYGIPFHIARDAGTIGEIIRQVQPDIIHAHTPGYPHAGDILGGVLRNVAARVPVVQTNVFGRLDNPAEDEWTRFRLFISWTSCVQAARRSFLGLDERFFQRSSVAVYPVDPVEPPAPAEVMQYRRDLGVQDDEVLFGRFSRPEPNKWTDLALRAFRIALRQNPKIKLLFRESPPAVSEALRNAPDADRYIILPATADPAELRKTMAGIDVVLHTSSIGESFGYGIAEAMALGKPVITHSVPWGDQAQIELARHGECGFVASTPRSMARCILELAGDKSRRIQMGTLSRNHIQQLSDPETSTSRIHRVLEAVIAGRTNPFLVEDLEKARETARYLDRHQFGNSASEQIALRPMYYWAVFHRWRKRNARAKQSD